MTNVSITGWLVTTSKCRLNQLKKYCKSVVQKQLIYVYSTFNFVTIIFIISWKKDPIILKLDKQFIYVWLSSCNSCEALDIFKLGQYLKTTLDMNLGPLLHQFGAPNQLTLHMHKP